MNIFIQYGRPLKQNEQKVTLAYCEYDFSVFRIYPYKFTELKQLVIDLNMTIRDLKKVFLEELGSKDLMPRKCTEDDFIIREQITERPGKIFNDLAVLNTLNFPENKKILIQEYKRDKFEWNMDKLQLTLRFWDASNWSISEPVEIQVDKHTKLKHLSEIIHKYFPNISCLGMSRVIAGYNVYMDDFLKFKFFDLKEMPESTIDNAPFYIQSEGSVLL
jgi:hypothetical protein